MSAPRGAAEAALDRFLDALYALRPVDATFIGMHEHDHRLPDWSPAGHESAVTAWTGVRDALAAARAAATDDDAVASGDWTLIDTALATSHCDLQLAELRGAHFTRCNPSLAIGEAAFAVIGLITRDFRAPAQRASWLLQRLRQVPGFLAGALATMHERRIPRAWKARALGEARATTALLVDGLPLWCRAMDLPADLARTVGDAAQLAAGGVHAFAEALEALPMLDVDAVPCGEDMLSLSVHRGHWITRSVEHLLEEVRAAFAEQRARLDEMVHRAGARDLAEVQSRLAAHHPMPDEYYAAFGRAWEACRQASLDHRLVTWPDAPLRYGPIPEWTRMAAPSLYYLFYRSPAPLDALPVHDYVVTPIEGLDGPALEGHLRAWNDSVIKLNHVVHHGALGHHVQNWWATRAPSRVGRVAATDGASRIAMLLGGTMAEGWACYATDLMDEVGFLTTDEAVAEQHSRVRQLARAVVDLEFHTGRRTFDEAVQLYALEVGMPADAARREVVKNSMFPGAAMMYWAGTQAIHDLRREVSRRLGARFDLRDFHDRFLSHGAVPVAVTARLMLRGR
jgi:hypothetical protein